MSNWLDDLHGAQRSNRALVDWLRSRAQALLIIGLEAFANELITCADVLDENTGAIDSAISTMLTDNVRDGRAAIDNAFLGIFERMTEQGGKP